MGEASRVQRVLRVLSLHLFLTIIIDLSMFFLSFNGPQEVKNRVLNTKRVQVIPSVLLLKSIQCYDGSFSSIMRYAKLMASLCALIYDCGLRILPFAVAGGILVGRFGPTWES